MERIWTPGFLFLLSDSKKDIKTLVDPHISIVTTESGSQVSPLSEKTNFHISNGNQSIIRMRAIYTVKSYCGFSMFLYPFDSHNCSLVIVPSTEEPLRLEIEKLEFAGVGKFSGFDLVSTHTSPYQDGFR